MGELMSLEKKIEEESRKELEDYKKFIYFEHDTFPNPIGNQQTSPPKSPKSLETHELHPVQSKSQSKGLEQQFEATELNLKKTKFGGPESQIVGPELDIEDHGEASGAILQIQSTYIGKICQNAPCT